MKIVLSAVLAMFLVACGENNTAEKNVQESVQSETVKVAEELTVEENKTVASTPAEETKALESVKEVVEEVKVIEKPAPVKVSAPVVEEKKVVEAPKEVVKNTIDGGALFAKCTACHGPNAEKSALGKSQVIQGWSADKTLTALHGYKDGTYGGAMKGIMKSQVSNYSEEELKALAQHISKL